MATKTNAKVILDSVSPTGVRLTTVETTYHRFIHPELMTHRVFSRNSASSRAIPVSKQIEAVLNDPAIPIQFGSAKKGMQSGPPLEGEELEHAIKVWVLASESAVCQAKVLLACNVHKEVVNRLLEPFLWHTVIITATEWSNFFRLRRHPTAQPEIQAIGNVIYDAMAQSTPQRLDYDEWHTPYIQPDEEFDVWDRRRISAGRCARVSYLTHAGIRDPQKDIDLFTRLKQDEHASPTEHVATPLIDDKEWGGNFRGWLQFRQVLGL